MATSCELCSKAGGELFWQDTFCRVVQVNDVDYPGFCRVILNKHVKEMTDLEHAEQEQLMAVVFAVEKCIRQVMRPDKINLACLGNMVPHVHWHVIPRYKKDRNFPNSIWDKAKRESLAHPIDQASASSLKAAIQLALA